jgi:hypothetical protein
MLLLALPVYLPTYSDVITPEQPKEFPVSLTLGNIIGVCRRIPTLAKNGEK